MKDILRDQLLKCKVYKKRGEKRDSALKFKEIEDKATKLQSECFGTEGKFEDKRKKMQKVRGKMLDALDESISQIDHRDTLSEAFDKLLDRIIVKWNAITLSDNP
jgi:hypothetical protein